MSQEVNWNQARQLYREYVASIEEAEAMVVGSVLIAKKLGEVLEQLKEEAVHGTFMDMQAKNFPGVEKSQLANFRKVAKHWDKISDEAKANSLKACLRDIDQANAKDKRAQKEQRLLKRLKNTPLKPHHERVQETLDGSSDSETKVRILPGRFGEDVRRSRQRRKLMQLKTGPVVFLDSGSFRLKTQADKYANEHGDPNSDRLKREFYKTDFFWRYVDAYASFVFRYQDRLTLYANVDAIGYDDITMDVQAYLESKNLKPVPVLHYGSPARRLWELAEKYELIALGNLVGNISETDCIQWIAQCEDILTELDAQGKPVSKLHGFGVGSFDSMRMFDWHTVDSTTWLQEAGNLNVYVPHASGSEFDFRQRPKKIRVNDCDAKDQQLAEEWLEAIDMTWDEVCEETEKNYSGRRKANVMYYEALQEHNPDIPTVYYSGHGQMDCPINYLGDVAHIMPTFWDYHDQEMKQRGGRDDTPPWECLPTSVEEGDA